MKKALFIALFALFAVSPVRAQYSNITSIQLRNSNNTVAQSFQGPFDIKVGADCTWSVSGVIATINCAGPAGGFITGPVTANHLIYASGADAGADVANSTVTGASGAITLAQNSTTTKQLVLTASGSFNNTVPVLDVSSSATVAAGGLVSIRGDADGTTFSLLDLASDDDNSLALTIRNNTKSATPGNNASIAMLNSGQLDIGNNEGNILIIAGIGNVAFTPGTSSPYYADNSSDPADSGVLRVGNNVSAVCAEHNPTGTDDCIAFNTGNVWTLGNLSASAGITAATYSTATNCADSAGAAACGSAAAGAFVVDAAATTTVVSTTAVTANSEILVMYDSSLGTRLGITCNTTAALPAVTARTAATSFTVTVPVAPITNPACYNYLVIN